MVCFTQTFYHRRQGILIPGVGSTFGTACCTCIFVAPSSRRIGNLKSNYQRLPHTFVQINPYLTKFYRAIVILLINTATANMFSYGTAIFIQSTGFSPSMIISCNNTIIRSSTIIISSQSSFSVAGGGDILFTDHEEWEERMSCLPLYRQ